MAADAPARCRLGVVVLHYRTPELVLDCLESAVPELDPARDALVVVDNASGDGSAERVRAALAARAAGPDAAQWHAVRLVESPENRGFSAGNNFGVRVLDADAYLLLNSDTLVRPGAFERLRATLDEDPGLGLIGPRLEDRDGTPQISCFRLLTPASELLRGAALGPLTRLLSRFEVPLAVRDEPFEPEWLSFAAVLVRRAVLDTVGPLDEGFFMYFEDVDYCRRARAAGWRIRYEPRARIVHLRGGTSPVKRLQAERRRRPEYFYVSRRRYFAKAFGRSGALRANLCWTLGRALAWLRERTSGRPPHAVERELRDLWSA
jgi:GT2 family glycosyltransferase